MGIPIIDINAGDTMSGMVDKINYNFTLLSLKGGGPMGVQGIQGIRGYTGLQGIQGFEGPAGATIHGIDPSTLPVSYLIPGDIYIHDGIIQQIDNDLNINTITNLNLAIQSPFGVPDDLSLQTINQHQEYDGYKFVLGAHAADDYANQYITNDTDKSRIYMLSNTGVGFEKYFKFYNGGFSDNELVGSVGFENNSGINIKSYDNNINAYMQISGPGNYAVKLTKDEIKLQGTKLSVINDYNVSNIYFITGVNSNYQVSGHAAYDNSKYWAVDNQTNAQTNAIFPISGVKNDIGKSQIANGNTRIDNIYFNKDSYIKFVSDDSEYLNIYADNLNGNTERPVITLSKTGIAVGGLKSQTGQTYSNIKSLYEDFGVSDGYFGMKLGTPWKNAARGTVFSMYSSTNIVSALVTNESNSWTHYTVLVPDLGTLAGYANPKWNNLHHITLSSDIDADLFMCEAYSNLITVDKKANNTLKTPNNVLHIHGADCHIKSNQYKGPGNDVVITGGNTFGESGDDFGGNVYISGGSAMRKNNGVDIDTTRFGNVIIGINPFHHKGGFNTVYTSADKRITDTNPDGVNFYDINMIAAHGNKIVLDSNANFRKQTGGFISKENNSNYNVNAKMTPWAESPEDTTMQVSCINTINHNEPIIISQNDICSHQFMSGVMRRVIRYGYSNNEISKAFVEDINETNEINDPGGQGRVYFITEQVWQKVGNIVNVTAFGRWVANQGNETYNLYHITDHFFANGLNSLDTSTNWFDGDTCKNRVLDAWLLNHDDGVAYAETRHLAEFGNPETVFAMPVAVSGMNASFCYGNGNIYTEDNMTRTRIEPNNWVTYNPTESVIQSSPVLIGAYHKTSVITNVFGYLNGDKSALHNDGNAAWKNNAKYTFDSISINMNDPRMALAANPDNYYWADTRYNMTEIKHENWQYVYPEMMTDDFRNSMTAGSSRRWRQSKRIRPCVGLYTYITFNYSYNIMSGFNTNDYVEQFEPNANNIMYMQTT